MSVESLLQQLESHVAAGNVDAGKQILSQLKIALLSSPSPAIAAAALELGVLLAVGDEDLEAFGLNMAQLLPIYMTGLSTPRKSHILGLHLMHLLVENRLAEFHAQLELLSDAEASSPMVSFPIGLERKLMVGIYDEVLTSAVPNASFQLFMNHLVSTVRDSIADCMEASYKSLSLTSAAAMMKFASVDELRAYIEEDRDDWVVEGEALTFQPPPSASVAEEIPSMQWIHQSLTYATEMERIV